eukprot:1004785-Pyramimonas_sp.AAC.1
MRSQGRSRDGFAQGWSGRLGSAVRGGCPPSSGAYRGASLARLRRASRLVMRRRSRDGEQTTAATRRISAKL